MEDSGKFYKIRGFYERQYKKLLIIPFALLAAAIILIMMKVAATGDFINRDVSLKGGLIVTLPVEQPVDIVQLKQSLAVQFLEHDIATKSISQLGKQVAIIVESDMLQDDADTLIAAVSSALGRELTEDDYSVEFVGPSLGAAFFKQLVVALLIAFVFMALVVFLYFRTIVPSLAVILAALSDIVVTLAIVNLLNIKLSTAGIAAFLMLIGYSVDTDILLSSRVLKRREGSEMQRIYGAMKTGMTMTATTLIAIAAALFISQSEVIRQIMTILLIGLLVDLINTWIQNTGLLRLYLERRAKKIQ